MYSRTHLSASVQNMVTNSDGEITLSCKIAYDSVMWIYITVGAIPSQKVMAHDLSRVWAVADTRVWVRGRSPWAALLLEGRHFSYKQNSWLSKKILLNKSGKMPVSLRQPYYSICRLYW